MEQEEHFAKSHLGTKSENRKRNIKAERMKNMRKLGRNMRKKNRKSSPKPRYDKLMECISLNSIGILRTFDDNLR